MDDTELRSRLDALEKKIDDAWISSEKTRKYLLAIIVVSAVAFILPLIGILFAIPAFVATYSQLIGI